MRNRCLSVVFVLSLLCGFAVITGADASAQGVCPDAITPPPPVDTSEKPAPGQIVPPPLPVPVQPAGGPRMGECGEVFPHSAPVPPETTAASWVVQDLDTGAIIAAKNPHARQRPASLIKMLLALAVLRELKPDQVVVATPEDASQECTCAGLVAGGRYTVDQLLHGLLMHSGNDAAHALATALGGVPTALRKMNALAAALGATDTRAATPSGLDGPGMSSSAYDLSLIYRAGMKDPLFADIVATKGYQFPAQLGNPAYSIVNDNKLLGRYPGFLGGKTGFTDDARHTYVGGAQQGGKRLAVVLMRAEQRPVPVVDQAAKLLDYGFALVKTGARPVGSVENPPTGAATRGDDGGQAVADKANAGAATKPRDPFGLTGWLVTLAVAVLIVIGFVVGNRRKRRS